ncbi:hypothetical protein PUN28_011759 [Cardiocondyla obscurior]|uniref:Uncharacterized protein n=1 Tax=Cardiocondyla obscurior TaxID=286306 RepID=A0AAW2FI67_9HYME
MLRGNPSTRQFLPRSLRPAEESLAIVQNRAGLTFSFASKSWRRWLTTGKVTTRVHYRRYPPAAIAFDQLEHGCSLNWRKLRPRYKSEEAKIITMFNLLTKPAISANTVALRAVVTTERERGRERAKELSRGAWCAH